MANRRTTIQVEPEAGGDGWDVIILPTPISIGHDMRFRNIREARRYARRLSAATGWALIDLCGAE